MQGGNLVTPILDIKLKGVNYFRPPFLFDTILISKDNATEGKRIYYAPNFSSLPKCARAMLIRYFIGIRPSPPVIHALSPKFTAISKQRLFYLDISFLDWISTFIYKEIYEKFQSELITKEHINVIKTQ
jgi:hypothetical protein